MEESDREGITSGVLDDARKWLAKPAPDYFDGHQHIHVFPQIGQALLRAVKTAAPQAWVRQCGRAQTAPKSLSDPKGYILDALSRRFRRLAKAQGELQLACLAANLHLLYRRTQPA